MKNIVLDLETVRNDVPFSGKPDDFPPPVHWNIVIAGIAVFRDYTIERFLSLRGDADVASGIARATNGTPTRIVGFNTRGFDLPVIAHACLRHCVAWPWYFGEARIRYKDTRSLDLMDWLSDHGASRSSKLDALARSIGWPGKGSVSGADVGAMVADGRIDDVGAYCLQDVAQTAALWLRYEVVRGNLTAEQWREADAALRRVISDDHRTAPLLAEEVAA